MIADKVARQKKKKKKLLEEQKKKAEEALRQLEEEQKEAEAEETFAYVQVFGTDNAKVDADVYKTVKPFSPLLFHCTTDGRWIPATRFAHEGQSVIMPLANLVMNTNDFEVGQHVEGSDFTKKNLTLLPKLLELEVFTTPQEYRREQKCRAENLRKKNH